jgi:hypothetical protein
MLHSLRFNKMHLAGMTIVASVFTFAIFYPFGQSNNTSTDQGNNGGVSNSANAAIQYADTHWNWTWYEENNHGTVGDGASQPGFQCSEFVSRALSAIGIFPGLNPYSPQGGSNSYSSYKGYAMVWVDRYHDGQVVASKGGLYEYLINEGYGTDIGNDLSRASPGDPVFYKYNSTTNDREHVALLVQIGNQQTTLIDAHNRAHLRKPYFWGVPSIVHLHLNDSQAANA